MEVIVQGNQISPVGVRKLRFTEKWLLINVEGMIELEIVHFTTPNGIIDSVSDHHGK